MLFGIRNQSFEGTRKINSRKDIQILRDLARQYAAIAAKPVQDERRALWAAHFGRKKTRPLVLVSFGMHNVWCRKVFGDSALQCAEAFYREHERALRMKIFHDRIGDDCIQEPWLTQGAAVKGSWDKPWGLLQSRHNPDVEGGAWQYDPPFKNWADTGKLTVTPHEIDEGETARNVSRLREALGDILPVDVVRGAFYSHFSADLSTHLARLRGLGQLMLDMYEYPDELRRLLAFMRDGILANNQSAEDAGDYSLTSQHNQAMPYAEELERPRPNSGAVKRKQLWTFCAAQEYTLISPQFHEEFLFQYQRPILERFGLVHYGCCEDLTRKIDLLRNLKNLRSIAVAPAADVRKCAEQIGADYILSWRPNPTDMVCCGWDERRIRTIIQQGLTACRGCFVHIHLKDIETVEDDPERLSRWVKIVRGIAGEY
ncbi:MAG: hypothetical protein HYV36_04255 [Lentisphaerae bacterium]|nr:hypothetical protein [Lentisphaerota bacterium]